MALTDKELIESLVAIDTSEADLTEFEEGFLSTMGSYIGCGLWWLSPKQRSCAEDLLKKLEAQGSEPVKITPPAGAEKYLRKRKAWEE